MANVAAWQTVHGQPAAYVPLPERLHPSIRAALRSRGIEQLYLHQGRAVEAALDGRNPVVVTPTASGKTLCYNLRSASSLLEPEAPHAHLFPTKALAQNSWRAHAWQCAGDEAQASTVTTYDGVAYQHSAHSPGAAPAHQPRHAAHGHPALPHQLGAVFRSAARYLVLDELHSYRGVFGSHVANVLRRLQRVCAFYGSRPQFICTSATIANPAELAGRVRSSSRHAHRRERRARQHIILYSPLHL